MGPDYLHEVEFSVRFVYPDDREDVVRSGAWKIEAPDPGIAETLFDMLFAERKEEEFVTLPEDGGWVNVLLEIHGAKDLGGATWEKGEQFGPLDPDD